MLDVFIELPHLPDVCRCAYRSRLGHRPSSSSGVLSGMGLEEECEQHAKDGEHTAYWVPSCSRIILRFVNSVETSKLVLAFGLSS